MRFKVTLARREEMELLAPSAERAVQHIREKILSTEPEGHLKLLSVELVSEPKAVVSIVDTSAG